MKSTPDLIFKFELEKICTVKPYFEIVIKMRLGDKNILISRHLNV